MEVFEGNDGVRSSLVLITILVHTDTEFRIFISCRLGGFQSEYKQNMQAENLRQLENENDDIGSHDYSTSLHVVHHCRASQSS